MKILAGVAIVGFLLLPLGWPGVKLAVDREWLADLPAQTPRLARVLATSIALAFASAFGALAIGIPLGAMTTRLSAATARAVNLLLVVGCFTPLVSIAGGWIGAFGPDGFFAIPGFSANRSLAFLWTAAIHAVFAAPLVAILVERALRSNRCIAEEDAWCCAKPSAVFWHGNLPSIRPALAVAGLLAAVPALTDMTVSDLFKIRTFSEEAFTEFETKGTASTTMAAAGLLAVLVACFGARFLHRNGLLVDVAATPLRLVARRTEGLIGLQFAALVAASLLLISTGGVVWQLGLVSQAQGIMAWDASTAATYLRREITHDVGLVGHNLAWSMLAAIIATGSAFCLAWVWHGIGSRRRHLLFGLLIWSLLTSGPVLAASLLEIWNINDSLGMLAGFYQTPVVLVSGWVVRLLPMASLLCGAGLATFVANLEPAILEGASGVRLAAFAVWGIRRWLTLAIACCTAAAFAELPLAHLLSAPGFDPLGVRMFQLLHTGSANQPAALAVTITGVVAALVSVIQLAARRIPGVQSSQSWRSA